MITSIMPFVDAHPTQWRRDLRLLLREKGAEWAAPANEARSVLVSARLEGQALPAATQLAWGERARASTICTQRPVPSGSM